MYGYVEYFEFSLQESRTKEGFIINSKKVLKTIDKIILDNLYNSIDE